MSSKSVKGRPAKVCKLSNNTEDLTSLTVCASKASGTWVVTGVAIQPVAEGKPFGRLLKLVKDFLDKNIDIIVDDAPKAKGR